MTNAIQLFSVSGNLVQLGTIGSQALQLNLLCAISAGSVVVPLSCNANGELNTV